MKNTILSDMAEITSRYLPWEKFANKTVLISGANGFLPAYMVETLLYLNDTRGLGIKIIGVVRNSQKANERFKRHLTRKDLRLSVQDITHQLNIDEKIDIIIHAASQASPKYFGSDPVGTLSANVLGTYQLLELARAKGSENFLYFSSGEVYGRVDEASVPIHETAYGCLDPLDVRSCYAESKRMGENMCVSYAHQYGLTVKIARSFHVYGPGLMLDDKRVYADFIADVVNQRNIKIYGDGSAIRSYCYLADATAGFFAILLNGENSAAYNIGNPDCCVSVMELATQLTEIFSDLNLKVVLDDAPHQPGYIANKISKSYPDISSAMGLGWKPKISIADGFTRTVRSFHEPA